MHVPVILILILVLCSFAEMRLTAQSQMKFRQGTTYSLLNRKPKRKVQWIPLCIGIFAIVLLGVMRGEFSMVDSDAYFELYYLNSDNYTWFELLTNWKIDNGFFFIIKFIKLFTSTYRSFLIILFCGTIFLYFYTIIKNSPYPSFSLLIFAGEGMIFFSMSILRQALACAIVFSGYRKILNKKYAPFLILSFLAFTIHKTAVLAVVILAVSVAWKRKMNDKDILLLSALSAILFVLVIPVLAKLYSDGLYSSLINHEGGYNLLAVMLCFVFILNYVIKKFDLCKDKTVIILFNITCCAVFLQIGALQWALLTRAKTFFVIFNTILLPCLVEKIKNKKRYTFYILSLIYYVAMFLYTSIGVNYTIH